MKATSSLILFVLLILREVLGLNKEGIRNDEYILDPKHKVEFIEKAQNLPYLSDITLDDRYYLDLYLLDQTLKSSNFKMDKTADQHCPKDVFKSLGLSGFMNPALRTDDIFYCDGMKLNCCSNGDFVTLENIWKDFKVYIEMNHSYYAYYMKAIAKNHDLFMETAAIMKNSTQHRMCKLSSDILLDLDKSPVDVDKMDQMMKEVKQFDLTLKRGFKCMLCDYENNRFINSEFQMVFYNTQMCLDIVKNTMEYFHYFNTVVWRYVNTIMTLAHCNNDKDQEKQGWFDFEPATGIEFMPVSNSLYYEQCYQAYKAQNETEIIAGCHNYCHDYKIWGYGGIFPDIVNASKIYNWINERIIKNSRVEVRDPLPEYAEYAFPFDHPKYDALGRYQTVFTVDGIIPQKLYDYSE